MKFLAQNKHTQQQLIAWANDRQLVLVKFFFWISGSELQRSIVGLYRAILWEILKQCPDLMPTVFPSRWESAEKEDSRVNHLPLSLAEVQEAFERLRETIGEKHALCLFIDGLDEYDGDHWKLGDALASWRSKYVKICVSARPYNGFQQTLPLDGSRHFQLHELNRRDMQDYIRDVLCKDTRFCLLQEQDQTSAKTIMHELGGRAEGVFVWTVLATKSLLEDITNQRSAYQLLNFLKTRIPNGLDALFHKLLKRIPSKDQKQAAISLLTISDPLLGRGINSRLAGFNLVFHHYIEQIVDELDHHRPHQDATNRPNLQQSSQSQLDAAKARLNSRCAGFVNWIDGSYEFQIAHRTLGDFLRHPDTKAILHKLASDIDLYMLLSRACLNIVQDFSGRQTDLHIIWPKAWGIVRILMSIANRTENGSGSIDDMMLSIFDMARTAPDICFRTDLRGVERCGYSIDFHGHRGKNNYIPAGNLAEKYKFGLIELLCQEIIEDNWNFIARARQKLVQLIPEASKPCILLATAVNAIHLKGIDLAKAFDFAESLLKTIVSPNLKVSGREIFTASFYFGRLRGREFQVHGYTVDFEQKEPTELTRKGTLGSSPSIWELFLQAASQLVLCMPSTPCEAAFKMIELFLAYGANPEMWLLVSNIRVASRTNSLAEGLGRVDFVDLPAKLHCVSLQQLVEVRKPPNSDIMRRHLLGSQPPNTSITYLANDQLSGPLGPLVVIDSPRLEKLNLDAAFLSVDNAGHLTLLEDVYLERSQKESDDAPQGWGSRELGDSLQRWLLQFGDRESFR